MLAVLARQRTIICGDTRVIWRIAGEEPKSVQFVMYPTNVSNPACSVKRQSRSSKHISETLSGASLHIGMARYSYYVLGRKRIGIYVSHITYHWPGPKVGRAQIGPGPIWAGPQCGPGPI